MLSESVRPSDRRTPDSTYLHVRGYEHKSVQGEQQSSKDSIVLSHCVVMVISDSRCAQQALQPGSWKCRRLSLFFKLRSLLVLSLCELSGQLCTEPGSASGAFLRGPASQNRFGELLTGMAPCFLTARTQVVVCNLSGRLICRGQLKSVRCSFGSNLSSIVYRWP